MKKTVPFLKSIVIAAFFFFSGCNYSTHSFNNGKLLDPGETMTTCSAGMRGFYKLTGDTLYPEWRQRHPGWRWHDFSFDRPLIFSIVNYYRLPRQFEVSVKFRYMSGIPYTDVQTGTNLSIGAYNAKRYSPYQSLDFRISRAYTIKKQRCHLYLEGYNILNAPNLFLNDNKTREVKMIGLNLPFPMLFAGFDVNN